MTDLTEALRLANQRIREQDEELAMYKAFLALAEAQRDSLRKRYLGENDANVRFN